MTAILDYCLPSRRRERQERKEQQALASRVNPRWGDTQITAPSEGGWNQPGSVSEQDKDPPVLPFVNGSPQNSGSSVNTTPDLSILYDKAVEAGITIEQKPEVATLPQQKEERKNISFTITLPWPSRRVNIPAVAPAAANSRPSTAQSSPPTAQIPSSERYVKDLGTAGKPPPMMNPLAQSPPDQAVEPSPVAPYIAAQESYALTDPVPSRVPSPPLHHTSPITRLETIPATPYCLDDFCNDPRLERPEAMVPSHPAVVERRSRARSSSREPHAERYARMRSSSRGPAEDRSGAMRPSSRPGREDRSSAMRSASGGPAEDRIRSTRSSSRDRGPDRPDNARSSSGGPPVDRFGTARSSSGGPPVDRFRTARSSSGGPPVDRFGAARSSSGGPPVDRFGTARSSSGGPPLDRFGTARSSSGGPPLDRFGTARSSSKGPPIDRTSRTRSTSMGPPTGRIAMVRSASREPTSERLSYSRASRRDSFSSDSSSATMFSDDIEDNKAMKHQKAPSKTIPNPNGVGQITVGQNGVSQSGGCGGYYSSLASEYRQIAKDVESQALPETDSSEGKEHKKMKDRLKEIYNEPQALVPSATDLYG